MNLSLLLLIPLITGMLVLFCRGLKEIRNVALTGATIQLLLSGWLLLAYMKQRSAGNNANMLFEYRHSWFPSLNIDYHIGVDGISIAMILLTAFVVLAGILISWSVEAMSKEYFFLLILLSVGADECPSGTQV